MIRTLVADDEPLMLAGIRTVLESAHDVEVAAQAGDRAMVDNAITSPVNVAVVDIKCPQWTDSPAIGTTPPGTRDQDGHAHFVRYPASPMS